MNTVAGGASLLELLEPGWRIRLSGGVLAGEVDVEPELRAAVARTLGGLSRVRPPGELAHRWPACVAVTLAQVSADCYRRGAFWSGWHRACGVRASRRADHDWGRAFMDALAALGFPPLPCDADTAVLVHMAVPTSFLGEVLRRLAVSTAPEQADPAVGALVRHGGPAAESLLDRCRTAIELLRTEDASSSAEELARLRLSSRIVDAARRTIGDLPKAEVTVRLDPYGQGVLVATEGRAALPEEAADPADPLLLFDEDGLALPGLLPPEPVWALHPAVRRLCADVPPRVLVEGQVPLTWRGWRLVQLALNGVSWVALDGPEEGTRSRRRRVRGRSRPRLVTGPAVPGVTTPGGLPVHAVLPALRLPTGDGRWRVEARRADGGPVLARAVAGAAEWDPGRLWAGVPRPLLGELVVSAVPLDGADGAGLRCTVAVAEGLAVEYSPELRLTHHQGLEPSEAVLLPTPGLTVAPRAAALAPGTERVEVRCVAGPVVRTLVVTPPRCRTRVEPEPGSGSSPTTLHTLGPLRLDLVEVEHGGALHLDLPGVAHPPPIEVVARGRAVQWLEPSRQGRYPLRRLLDTVAAHGGADLRVTVAGRTATVAHIAAPLPDRDPWLPKQAARAPVSSP